MAVIDPASRTARMQRQAEAAWTQDFLSVLAVLRGRIDLDELAALLASGRTEQAMGLVTRAARRLSVLYADTYTTAGRATAQWLSREVQDVEFAFDVVNTRAVRRMSDASLRLVREFSRQQRSATRQALVEGIRAGANPREQARAFVDSLGLTEYQEGIVRNYGRSLRTLNSDALTRRLRDRRFDPTVRAAIRNEEPLSEAQIGRMVDRYRDRWRTYRAENIARTESLRAVNEGVADAYAQAIDEGQLRAEQLTKEWNTAKDERVRDSHAEMHGQVVTVDQPFVSGLGNQAFYPGGFGVAADDINCRCAVGTRIASLAPDQVPEGLNVEVVEV